MKSITAFSLLAVLAAQLGEAAPTKLEARAAAPALVPTGNSVLQWTSIGCYQDTYDTSRQILKYYQYQPLMTFASCSTFCTAGGYKFMGMSNGAWCYCDNQINLYNGLGYATTADKCNIAANGDPLVNAGAFWTNAMFELTTAYNADQAASKSAASASAAQSASAYSAAQSASAYSAGQSASAYSAAQSVSAYSAAKSASAYSANLVAQSASAYSAAQSVSAYSAAQSASAYSAAVVAQSASAYSAAQSASAYSAGQSASAYSAAQSASAYSAARSASAYSANVAAQSASAYSAGQSASAYSAAQSASAYSAAQSASAYSAAQSVSAYSAAQSASAYSAASAASASSAASAASYSASSSAAAAAATVVPAPWTAASVSCVAEGTKGRALTGASTASDDMTYNKCLSFCGSKGFPIAGIEYSRECYCGSALSNGASLNNPSSNCNMACAGSPSTTCGGPNALTVFVIPGNITGLQADLTPASAQLPTGWTVASTACVAEGNTGRALTGASTSASDMTGAKCATFCASKGFSIAGTEYAQECYCGNALGNGASLNTPSTACNMACAGDQTSTCGGPGALNVYVNPSITPATTASAAATAPTAPTNLPSGWSAASSPCIQEVQGRSLTGASTSLPNMTVGTCLSFCQAQGFQYAGLEFGQECYCGNALVNGASLSSTSQSCNMACGGDSTSTCGGANGVQLYVNPSLAPAVSLAPSSNGMVSKGCIQEVSGRALTGMRVDYTDMTIDKCTAACAAAGYSMAGVEYGQECYCGNSLVNGASLSLVSGQCYMSCPGNASQKCGGPNAIVLYGV